MQTWYTPHGGNSTLNAVGSKSTRMFLFIWAMCATIACICLFSSSASVNFAAGNSSGSSSISGRGRAGKGLAHQTEIRKVEGINEHYYTHEFEGGDGEIPAATADTAFDATSGAGIRTAKRTHSSPLSRNRISGEDNNSNILNLRGNLHLHSHTAAGAEEEKEEGRSIALSLGDRYELGTTCPHIWHGSGSPDSSSFPRGSCWCGRDAYCMCTPSLAIDAIIEHQGTALAGDIVDGNAAGAGGDGGGGITSDGNLSIILVRRRDPPLHTYAIPGGFVNVGEDMHAAVAREVFEETGLMLDLAHIELFTVKSDPKRDKRRHTVSLVYRCRVPRNDLSLLKAHGGDDAKGVEVVAATKLHELNLAFDHKQILNEYLLKYHPAAAALAELG